MSIQLLKSLSKTTLALVICLFLASCFYGCYEDPDFSQELPYVEKTKDFTIDPKKDEWLDTEIDILNDDVKIDSSASIIAQGMVSLCETRNSHRSLDYVSICRKTQFDGAATEYSTYLCLDSKTGKYNECVSSRIDSPNLLTMPSLPCSAQQENFVCDNGILYKPDGQGSWKRDENPCTFSSFCKECATGDLFCSNGLLSYLNIPNSSSNEAQYEEETVPGSRCSASLSEYKIDALKNEWNQIADDKGIKAGDIVTLSIMKPKDPPLYLTKEKTLIPIKNNDEFISFNTYTPDVNRYSNAPKDCPSQLSYNTPLNGCNFFTQNGGYLNCDIYQAGRTINEYCLWMTFGTGLKLASDDTCNNSNALKAPSISRELVDFTDNSNSPYGKYLPLDDPNRKNNKQGGNRTFVAQKHMNKLCAGIYDDNPEDNKGGYILTADVKSCVGLDGHTSPAADSSNPNMGGLMYTFSSAKPSADTSGSPIFPEKKFYDPDSTNSTSSTATIKNQTNSSRLYLKISLPTNGDAKAYTGLYSVKVKYKEYYMKIAISSIIDNIKNFIKEIMFGDGTSKGSLQAYFKDIGGDINYSRYVTILLVLYIVLYGLSFLTGNTQISQSDLLIHVIKIGLVIALISDASWNFFHNYFFQIFINGTDDLIRMFGISGCVGECSTFYFVDQSLALLLGTPSTLLKMLALIFMSPLGIIIVMLVIIGVFYFLLGVLSAIVAYLLCVMAIAILISLAPIFIPFALFDFTEYLFEQWWKLMARYTLEPVLLIFGLQILVQIFYVTLIQLLDFTVCWKCVWTFNFDFSPVGGLLDGANINKTLCIPFFGAFGIFPGGGGASFLGQFSGSLASGLILIIIALVIRQYTSFVNTIMDNIIGQSPGADYSDSKGKKQDRDAGAFLRDKIGVSRFENYAASRARAGVKALTGFSIKTDEEIEKEKDNKKAKQKEEYEKDKRRGFRMLTGGSFDLDARKLDKAFESTADQKSLEALKGTDQAAKNAAAAKLGEQMFANIAKDKYSSAAFEKGLTKLASMDSAKLDKLPKASQLKDLHALLQQEPIKTAMKDFTKPDDAARKAAQLHIGKAMYSDANIAKSLSDRQARGDIVSGLLKLARESD